MPSQDRRTRNRENLRRAILDVARDLFATEGFDAVSIRKIANRIEYSPTAIYLHFKDKNEILSELIDEGFGLLIEVLSPVQELTDPVERLRRGGRAYLKFAFDNPHYYRLMFQLQDKTLCEQIVPNCERAHIAFAFVRSTIEEMMVQGLIASDVPEPVVSHAVLGNVHGAASMALAGHLTLLPSELHPAFYEYVIEQTLHGILK